MNVFHMFTAPQLVVQQIKLMEFALM